MSEFSFSIALPIQNEWKNIDLLRSSIETCFTAVFGGMEHCHALAMVTGELAENAIKYGDWTGQERSFHLQVHGNSDHGVVCVENPVREVDVRIEELLETVAWIAGFSDQGAAYRARLLEIANRPGNSDESKLGLVRVAYEGNARLKAELEGQKLKVTAEMTFQQASS